MALHDPRCLLRARLSSCEKFWSFVVDLDVNAGVLGTLPTDVLVRSDIDASTSGVVVARLLPARVRVVGSLVVIAIVVSGFIVTPVLRRGPSAALHVRRQIAIGIRTARSQSVAIGCAVCIHAAVSVMIVVTILHITVVYDTRPQWLRQLEREQRLCRN